MGSSIKSIIDNSLMKWLTFIFGALGFFWLIYDNFIKIDTPLLQYEVMSNVQILNKEESVSSLRIMIDTLDINKSENNISIYKIKVINNGGECITKKLYDDGDFGIFIKNGKLVEYPSLMTASTAHIKDRFLNIQIKNKKNFINIPSITLDVEEFYIIKFAVIHKSIDEPLFEVKGKIINQKEILLVDVNENDVFWYNKAYSGEFIIQIARILLYGIILLIIFFTSIYLLVDVLPEKKKKYKRRKIIKQIKTSDDVDNDVLNDYIKFGDTFIARTNTILQTPITKLNSQYNKSIHYVESMSSKNSNNKEQYKFHNDRRSVYLNLINSGYLQIDGDNITINKNKKITVKNYYDLLKHNGLISKYIDDFSYDLY